MSKLSQVATARSERVLLRATRINTRPRLDLPGSIAAGVIAVVVLVAIFAPVLPIADPLDGDTKRRLLSVGTDGHLLGTDGIGRDLFSRLLWGSRTALIAGIVPVLVGGFVGGTLGLVAGLAKPIVGTVIMRLLDVMFAFPALLLAIVIAATLDPGLTTIMIAIAVIIVPPVARIAETETSRIKSRDFTVVARGSGAGWPTIAFRHVLPHLAPALLVYCTMLVGLSIIYTGGLSFLGLGIAPPTPDWGSMVSEMRQFVYSYPELALIPAIPIVIVSVSFNVLGNSLRDALAIDGLTR